MLAITSDVRSPVWTAVRSSRTFESSRLSCGTLISQGVLIVKGVCDDGLRELLAIEVADTENEVTYEALFPTFVVSISEGFRGSRFAGHAALRRHDGVVLRHLAA